MDSEANSSAKPTFFYCVSSMPSRNIVTVWFTVYLLILPVFLLVLYIGFNKWKKPQSPASGGLSHSDVFTLNTVAMEMICIIWLCVILYGFYTFNGQAVYAGQYSVVITIIGQMQFHTLTCVERYLAVVHPVAYLRLRGAGGVTARNISIPVVWALSVLYGLPMNILNEPAIYGLFGFLLSCMSLPFVAYCSIYVLCVLTRPKPGEGGGQRKQIDQSKRSTVYTMVAMLGALLLRVMVFLVNGCVTFWFWEEVDVCAMISGSFCSTLPSSLVLPLLFLHRTRNK